MDILYAQSRIDSSTVDGNSNRLHWTTRGHESSPDRQKGSIPLELRPLGLDLKRGSNVPGKRCFRKTPKDRNADTWLIPCQNFNFNGGTGFATTTFNDQLFTPLNPFDQNRTIYNLTVNRDATSGWDWPIRQQNFDGIMYGVLAINHCSSDRSPHRMDGCQTNEAVLTLSFNDFTTCGFNGLVNDHRKLWG